MITLLLVAQLSFPSAGKIVLGGMIISSGLDQATTAYSCAVDGLHETNTLLAKNCDRPLTLGLIKTGIATGMTYGVYRLIKSERKSNRIIGYLSGVGISGIWLTAAIHNRNLINHVRNK